MAVSSDDVKICMGIEDVTSITSNQITSAIADAQTMVDGITDDLAIKYYASYLLAKRIDWMSLKKEGDVEFNPPKPEGFLELYNIRLNDILTKRDGEAPGIVQINPRYE